jgi:hypothetical protein
MPTFSLNVHTELSPEVAEVVGLHLGDGCMVRYHSKNEWMSMVGFTGNIAEFSYYENFVKPTIESFFGVKGRLYLREEDHTTRFVIYSKDLVQHLIALGLPLGKKHDASIPPLIIEQGLTVPCIRGFYHAEGSIYHRYSKAYEGHARIYDNLLTLQIRTKLKTLMNQISEELSRLQIGCNRLTAKDDVYTLRITKQSEIAKFFATIQPRLKVQPHVKNPLIVG